MGLRRVIPAIGGNGTIYVGSYDGHIYAIDPDGTLDWRYKTGGWIDSSPVIGDDGTVYVGSGEANLYSLKSESSGPADSPWPMFGRDRKHSSNLKG